MDKSYNLRAVLYLSAWTSDIEIFNILAASPGWGVIINLSFYYDKKYEFILDLPDDLKEVLSVLEKDNEWKR